MPETAAKTNMRLGDLGAGKTYRKRGFYLPLPPLHFPQENSYQASALAQQASNKKPHSAMPNESGSADTQ